MNDSWGQGSDAKGWRVAGRGAAPRIFFRGARPATRSDDFPQLLRDPLGALSVLVARHGGAREVVVTDLLDEPLKVVARLGADRTINMAGRPDGLAGYQQDKGTFDVVLEASGAGPAIAAAAAAARPGAVMVQVGLGGAETALPLNMFVAKELTLRGTFRFHEEFAWAVDFIAWRKIDVRPLLSAVLPVSEARRLRPRFRPQTID
ncbi:MAG: zinc-binding dehydrogenase [Acetobacteraceae bacterium]